MKSFGFLSALIALVAIVVGARFMFSTDSKSGGIREKPAQDITGAVTEASQETVEPTRTPPSPQPESLEPHKEEPFRTWSLADGTTVEAQLILTNERHALLLKADAQQVKIARASLKGGDLAYVDAVHKRFEKKGDLKTSDGSSGPKIVEQTLEGDPRLLPKRIARVPVVNGEAHGTAQAIAAPGKICRSEDYVNGVSHGDTINYYPSGNIAFISRTSNGQQFGKVFTFYEDGTLCTVQQTGNENQPGFYIAYFKSGVLNCYYPLAGDQRHGQSKHFTASGQLYGIQDWSNGQQMDVNIVQEINATQAAELKIVAAASSGRPEGATLFELWEQAGAK